MSDTSNEFQANARPFSSKVIKNYWVIFEPGEDRVYIIPTPPIGLKRGEHTKVFRVEHLEEEPVPIDGVLNGPIETVRAQLSRLLSATR